MPVYVPPEDRVLDRLVRFDERSRGWDVRPLLEAQGLTEPRSYTWNIPAELPGFPLDQGREGECVGFGFTHELAARPDVHRDVGQPFARDLYRRCKGIDGYPGVEGTTVIAGAQLLKADGRCKEYRWCFGIDDVVLTIGRKGPVVLGINWPEGFDRPDPETGIARATGSYRGGHCILANSVSLRRDLIGLPNSWGLRYGKNGVVWVPISDLAEVLADDGEACALIRR